MSGKKSVPKPPHPIVLDCIRQHYTYDPNVGLIYRNDKAVGKKRKQADYVRIMITISSDEYLCMSCAIAAHHIAWYLTHGEWVPPDKMIDHIDGDATNNRLTNLRLVTHSQNMQNKRKVQKKASSVYKGVVWNDNRWVARIMGQELGRYKSEEEAARAYDEKAREVFGEYAKCNFGENSAIRKPNNDK